MPSDRYVHMKGRYVHLHGGRRTGGAILLNSVEKDPQGDGNSNKIVGVITQQVRPAMDGGKLLKHIHFGSSHKKDQERIKFIF